MATQMTRAEYEAKYGVAPVVSTSTLDTTPAPVRMTRAEYNAIYRPETPQKETLGTKLVDRGGDIYRGVTENVGIRAPLRVGGAITGALGDIASAAISPVIEATTEAISDISAVQKLADSKAIRSGLDVVEKGTESGGKLWKEFETAQPKIAQDIKDVTNIAMTVPFGKPAKVALDTVTPPIKQALDERTLIKREQTLFDIESGYAKGRKANEYSKDAGSASRNRIAQTDVLVGAVDENGLIRTKGQGGAVEKYKAQTIDGVESVVRDNLIRENKTINLKEVENYLKLKIAESGLEGGDLINALGGVKKELQGLQLRADELGNVPLAKVHDAKISTTNNIDFNTPAETKTYRKALAQGYKELVERKSETEVKKVNSELAKYYEDIERLERLDGMRVKGGKLGKYFAQTAGTMIGMGAGSVGGGVGAALGGMIGGEVAGAIKGKALAGTMGKAGKEVPKNPILEKAKADSKLPAERPLTQPDLKLGAPKGLPKTKEVVKLEGQIAKNVEAQRKAIKAGDFTLVATLKEIYDVLVAELKNLVKELKTNKGGYVNFGAPLRDKKPKASAIHKEDREGMELWINNARIGTPMTEKQASAIEKLMERFDISPDLSAAKIATKFEDILSGKTQVKGTALTGRNFKENNAIPSLEQEAKKYKSAEEFVNRSGGENVYHGGSLSGEIDVAKGERGFYGKGFYVTDTPEIASKYNKNVSELKLNPSRIVERNAPLSEDFITKFDSKFDAPDAYTYGEAYNHIAKLKGEDVATKFFAENGVDGWRVKSPTGLSDTSTSITVFNKDALKTKSQLTDIWNKANAKK